MTIWDPVSGRYARMTCVTWQNVRVGQTLRYGDEEWIVVAVH